MIGIYHRLFWNLIKDDATNLKTMVAAKLSLWCQAGPNKFRVNFIGQIAEFNKHSTISDIFKSPTYSDKFYGQRSLYIYQVLSPSMMYGITVVFIASRY